MAMSQQCERCGAALDLSHDEEPLRYDGQALCSDCYCEQAHFRCARCHACGEVEDQHHYVAVFAPEEAFGPSVGLWTDADRTWRGLYRVEDSPYYCQGLLGSGYLYHRSLTWVAALPEDLEEPDDYPCGHFCTDCQHLTLEEEAQRALCGMVAALLSTHS